MYGLLQDFRHALRMLLKSPGFTAIAVLTLGLGIGANTAMFSVSNNYLRNPISFPEVDHLAMVMNQAPGQTEGWTEVSPAAFEEWRAQNKSFESLAAYYWVSQNLTGVGEPVRVQGFAVSANFFDVLRATPLLGRTFAKSEDELGRGQEVILSAGLWRPPVGSDPGIVGRTVRLDGMPHQVIGVMQDAVRFSGQRRAVGSHGAHSTGQGAAQPALSVSCREAEAGNHHRAGAGGDGHDSRPTECAFSGPGKRLERADNPDRQVRGRPRP